MSKSITELIEAWDGLSIVTRYDRLTEAWLFIALHNDTLGTPAGGTRMKVYDCPEDGLLDAMRLAEGMTHKWAAIDMGYGGGKAVLALSRPLDSESRHGLLLRYGQLLKSMGGWFMTGEDLGTTPADMTLLMRESSYVLGNDGTGKALDPGPYTALGVFNGIRAATRHVLGSSELSGVRVLVQGVGDVGGRLVELLAGAGARVLVSDLDSIRAQNLAKLAGGEVIPPEAVYHTPCDVYAPCAVGATLNRNTIPNLRCRIVAGSANNQLEAALDADRLHQHGICYAPDYVTNAGGAISFAMMAHGAKDETAIKARIAGLGATLDEIFAEAAANNTTPLKASNARIQRVLNHSTQGADFSSRIRPGRAVRDA